MRVLLGGLVASTLLAACTYGPHPAPERPRRPDPEVERAHAPRPAEEEAYRPPDFPWPGYDRSSPAEPARPESLGIEPSPPPAPPPSPFWGPGYAAPPYPHYPHVWGYPYYGYHGGAWVIRRSTPWPWYWYWYHHPKKVKKD